MSQEAQIVVEREGALGWVRINRPERLNAFISPMRQDLEVALAELDADPHVRCVVLTGVGRAFSTGGDVEVMAQLAREGDEGGFDALVRAGARVVQRIDGMATPVLAAVNGPAAGAGACLALACDLRIASEGASLGLTFSRVGLHPDWGGTYFLTRLVGPALAAELVLTGATIGAERAERLGLFNRVVAHAELEPTIRGIAGQIAAGPREVISRARRSLRHAGNASLAEVLEMERQAQLAAFRSPDFQEGVTAFLEKRTPRFGRNGGTGASGAHGTGEAAGSTAHKRTPWGSGAA